MKDFFSKYWKFIIPIIILAVVVAGYFIFFFNKNSSGNIEFIDLAKNYKFVIPKNYKVNPNANQKSLIIINENAKQYDPNNYEDLVNNKAIIIQSYTKFNKNDEIFEQYIKKNFPSNDKREIEINFEEINGNKVADIKVNYKGTNEKEYIKIINSYYSVLISSVELSEEYNSIVKSITEIDEKNKDYFYLTNQIRLIGGLLNANMSNEIYSLFTEEYKNKFSENDIKEILQKSEKMCQRPISFVGGELNNNNNEFSIRLIMINPDDAKEVRYDSRLVLKKEKGEWLINEIKIAEDKKENAKEESQPVNLDQESINKALEKAQE